MAMTNPLTSLWNLIKVRPADPGDRVSAQIFTQTTAGVRVTPDAAFSVSVVWACVDIIASALSSSDWNVYQGVRGDDNTTAVPNDSLHYILNTRMNPECTAQAGKRALALSAVGYGNGYAEIERDMAGRIIALWPIEPDRVEVRRDTQTGRMFYRITQEYSGGTIDMDPSDIFHIRGAGLTGLVGDSVFTRTLQAVAQAIALDQFGSAYFGNNAQLGTVFVYKGGKLDDSHYERLKQSLERRYRGAAQAFKTAIFDGGDWDVKSIGTTADKAQLIEAKQQIIEDICRFFHVPPHKVQHLLRATNNNIEHQGLEFTRDTLRPWVKEIEQEADYKLIPARGAQKFVILDLDWAELGDYKSRAEAYQIYRNMGVFSANDILRKLGENTIGEAGDIRIVQGANVRLEDVGIAYTDNVDPSPGDDTPRTAEPDEEDDEGDEDEDEMATAWLTSVFARIQTMHRHRAAVKSDEEARADAEGYAVDQLAPLNKFLGLRKFEAKKAVPHLCDGADPKQLAALVVANESVDQAMLVDGLRNKLDL